MHSDTLTQVTMLSSGDEGDIKRTYSFVTKSFIFLCSCTSPAATSNFLGSVVVGYDGIVGV